MSIKYKIDKIYTMFYAFKKQINMKIEYPIWDNSNTIPNLNNDKLKTFQSNELYHFCIARIDNYNEILNHVYNQCNQIDVNVFNDLFKINDSLIGYDDNQLDIIKNRNPLLISYVTANHYIYLTLLFKNLPKFKNDEISILEFGGGFGNVARILLKYCSDIINYDIADQSGMSCLQKYFLHENSITSNNVSYINTDTDLKINKKYNLIIANHSLSELPLDKYFNYIHMIKSTDYLLYSTSFGTYSEYIKIFHLISEMEIIDIHFEGSGVAHFLLKNK